MRVGGAAHTHVIGPTCELSGPRASYRAHVRYQGTCTGHDVIVTGTRHIQPTKIAAFLLDKAEKSPFQQHVVSYNPERKLSLEATEASRESSQRVRKTNTPLSSVRRPMGES